MTMTNGRCAVLTGLSDVLDVEEAELSGEKVLADLRGWDSVTALRALTRVEKAAGVRIPLEQYLAIKTVGDLDRLVTKVLGHG